MIKMRVNRKADSVCQECGCKWQNTPEMYDLAICDDIYTLCKDCIDDVFRKTLRMTCMYNSKVKSKDDMQRVKNYTKWRFGNEIQKSYRG